MIAHTILVIWVSVFFVADGAQTISAALASAFNELPSFSRLHEQEADAGPSNEVHAKSEEPGSQSSGLRLSPRQAATNQVDSVSTDSVQEAHDLVKQRRKELEEAEKELTHEEDLLAGNKALHEAVQQQILADQKVAEDRQRKLEEKFTQLIEKVKAKAREEQSASKLALVQMDQMERQRVDAQTQMMAETARNMKGIMSMSQSLSKQQDAIKDKVAQTQQIASHLIDSNRNLTLALHDEERTQSSFSDYLGTLEKNTSRISLIARFAKRLSMHQVESQDITQRKLTTMADDVKALEQKTTSIGEVMQHVANSIMLPALPDARTDQASLRSA